MAAWARLLDDEWESWRLLLDEAQREGEFEMFVKIGNKKVVNLNHVTFVNRNEIDGAITINFVDADDCITFRSGESGYTEIATWFEEQPMLLGDDR